MRDVYTLGFAKKSLHRFVELLREGQVKRLVDIRLHNTSQLAGFAKKDDLAYIMELLGIDYVHDVSLAPTEELLADYQKKRIGHEEFARRCEQLLRERGVEDRLDEIVGEGNCCFLCGEHEPDHCHRRVLAEYLRKFDGRIRIHHLM